jgi:hypothetical protein
VEQAMDTDTQDETATRERAYYLWEAEGRPEGRELEFWMRATVALTEKAQADTIVEPPPEAKKPE